jgi:hypothetical protein
MHIFSFCSGVFCGLALAMYIAPSQATQPLNSNNIQTISVKESLNLPEVDSEFKTYIDECVSLTENRKLCLETWEQK